MKRSRVCFLLNVLLFAIIISGCNIIEPGADIEAYGIQAESPIFNPPEGMYNVPSLAVEINSETDGATIFYAFEEDIPNGIDTWVFALQSLNRGEVDNCAALFYNPTGDRYINDIVALSDCYNIFYDLNRTLPGGAYQWLYELEGVTERTVNDCLDLFNAESDSLNVVNLHIGDCYKVFNALNESVTHGLESWLYTGPFTITNDTRLSAVAYKDGMDPSDLVTVAYDIVWTPPPPNMIPSINITYPINTTFFGEDNIIVKTDTSDLDGNITKVEFIKHVVGIDWEILGTVTEEPFEFVIMNVSEGNFVLEAKVYDDAEDTNSSKIEIEVLSKLLAPKENNTPPNISFKEPSDGDSFEPGDVVWLKTEAIDADGVIIKVDFFEDGTIIGSDDSRPFNFAWDAVTEDSYTFSARATDSDGASAITDQLSIKVARKFSNKKPIINFIRPKNKDHFVTDNITIEASASDSDGYIERVEFYRDGTVLLNTDLTKPFEFNWERVGAGEYYLSAKTYDFEGGLGETDSITITVNPTSSGDNDLPNVSIIYPENHEKFVAGKIIPIKVNASDNKSIELVEFLLDENLIGKLSSKPYIYHWNASVGEYELRARAYDNKGDSTLSEPVKIVVKPTIYCGDGSCNADETCNSCQLDCGKCESSKSAAETITNIITGETDDSGITVKSNDQTEEVEEVEFIVSEEAKQNVKERSWLRDFKPSWIWGPVLVLCIAILLFYIIRFGMISGFKPNPGIPKESLAQARSYIHKMLVLEYDIEHMKEKMKSSGWTDEQLEYVFALYDVKKMIELKQGKKEN